MTPQKMFSDALERVQLDPAAVSLSPIEQARKAALILLVESSPQAPANTDIDGERYSAGLAYVANGNIEPDGHEDETNAPYYFGHSAINAFEAGAIWQGQRCAQKALADAMEVIDLVSAAPNAKEAAMSMAVGQGYADALFEQELISREQCLVLHSKLVEVLSKWKRPDHVVSPE